MKISFDNDIISCVDEEKEIKKILINELDPKKLIELLELCTSAETKLEFTEGPDISPFSRKLKELIESAFSKSQD